MFCCTPRIWCLFLPPTPNRLFTPNYATEVLKLWFNNLLFKQRTSRTLQHFSYSKFFLKKTFDIIHKQTLKLNKNRREEIEDT
jgi:hypothetical protein